MSTLTSMTDPAAGQHAGGYPNSLLTPRQKQTVERLPPGHVFVGVLGRTPIVRRPDGHLSRMRVGGRLVKTAGVQAQQSYLLVQG